MPLRDGARIAVIGGGPAGSFFAHFARKWAERKGLRVTVTIFDGKDFLERGPRGCNLCAGVIARSLEAGLEKEGLVLPEKRILSRVEGYTLHVGHESLSLSGGSTGKKPIATVFRGNGPRFSRFPDVISFDDFLLSWAEDRGAEVIPQPVWRVMLPPDPSRRVTLLFGDQGNPEHFEADLVVGAFGVNTPLLREVNELGFGYRPPTTLTTFQAEFRLDSGEAKKRYGDNIHVYLSPSRTIRSATAVPKGDYLTVTLVGKKDMGPARLREFFGHHELWKDLAPLKPHCYCFPRIAVSAARRPFFHRLVLIGDASFSRHYKNGIESAFLTARLAAAAAFNRGVDAGSFAAAYYRPARALIVRDNLYGRILFRLNDLISSIGPLARSHISLAKRKSSGHASAQIQRILWSMFTGEVPYREIFAMAWDVRLQTALCLNMLRLLVDEAKHILKKAFPFQ